MMPRPEEDQAAAAQKRQRTEPALEPEEAFAARFPVS